MNERFQGPSQRRVLTPLWVIALFISLTETVLGVGVIQTSGSIQIALTVFVLFFPLLIAGIFFYILWRRPWVLYAPGEYGTGTDVTDYVREMSGRQKQPDELHIYAQIQQSIREALTSQQVISELSQLKVREGHTAQETVKSILSDAATNAEENILSKAFLTIDTRTFSNSGNIWQVPYDRYDTISFLLDEIYTSLNRQVPPFTYGKTWILQDKASGHIFRNMGRNFANRHGEIKDVRKLAEVGIKPGMTLQVLAQQGNL